MAKNFFFSHSGNDIFGRSAFPVGWGDQSAKYLLPLLYFRTSPPEKKSSIKHARTRLRRRPWYALDMSHRGGGGNDFLIRPPLPSHIIHISIRTNDSLGLSSYTVHAEYMSGGTLMASYFRRRRLEGEENEKWSYALFELLIIAYLFLLFLILLSLSARHGRYFLRGLLYTWLFRTFKDTVLLLSQEGKKV